jgi:soluble lytic murein transglycosylase-like protein
MVTKEAILKLILLLAPKHHVDPALVAAIVDVESQFRVDATGAIGERGLMQLHPRYFEGDEHYDPLTNLEAGMEKLRRDRRSCKIPLVLGVVICYNQGVSGAQRVLSPDQHPYYRKVLDTYPTYAEYFQKAAAQTRPQIRLERRDMDRPARPSEASRRRPGHLSRRPLLD